LRKLVLGIPAQAIGKNLTRLIIACGAPAVPYDYAQDRLCSSRFIPSKGYKTYYAMMIWTPHYSRDVYLMHRKLNNVAKRKPK